jgi:hypothetical protein
LLAMKDALLAARPETTVPRDALLAARPETTVPRDALLAARDALLSASLLTSITIDVTISAAIFDVFKLLSLAHRWFMEQLDFAKDDWRS